MIDWTKPIRQKNGRRAVCYTAEGKDPRYPIVIEYEDPDGDWAIDRHSCETNRFENIPERVVRYSNIYLDSGCASNLYSTMDNARQGATKGCCGHVQMTFEGPKLISAEVVE